MVKFARDGLINMQQQGFTAFLQYKALTKSTTAATAALLGSQPAVGGTTYTTQLVTVQEMMTACMPSEPDSFAEISVNVLHALLSLGPQLSWQLTTSVDSTIYVPYKSTEDLIIVPPMRVDHDNESFNIDAARLFETYAGDGSGPVEKLRIMCTVIAKNNIVTVVFASESVDVNCLSEEEFSPSAKAAVKAMFDVWADKMLPQLRRVEAGGKSGSLTSRQHAMLAAAAKPGFKVHFLGDAMPTCYPISLRSLSIYYATLTLLREKRDKRKHLTKAKDFVRFKCCFAPVNNCLLTLRMQGDIGPTHVQNKLLVDLFGGRQVSVLVSEFGDPRRRP